MKKSLSLIAAALLIGSTPQFAQGAEPKQSEYVGVDAISSIRSAYEGRQYDAFLAQMEQEYQESLAQGALTNLVSLRQGSADQEWLDLESAIQQERNQGLAALVAKEEPTPFTEKVRSAASELAPNVSQAFTTLSSFRHMAPGSGNSSDENAIIDIDLAYEYKALHLDRPGKPTADRRAEHYALKMEQMDRLVEASRSFQDPALKEAVATASANLDVFLAKNWDRTDLSALGKGRIEPSSTLEEKAALLLSSSQAKFSDLSKQLLEDRTQAK